MSSKPSFSKDAIGLIDLIKCNIKNPSVTGIERLEGIIRNHKINTQPRKIECDLTFKNINSGDIELPQVTRNRIGDISLQLRVELTESSTGPTEIRDCILYEQKVTEYTIQLIASAPIKGEEKRCKMSWHLDRHIRNKDNSDGFGKGFIHPEYHFSVGGFAMTKDNKMDYGDVLLLDTPRLIHPPLGLILSIDFVLRNFYGKKLKNMITSKKYKDIIKRAKIRLWRPYYIALAHYFEPNYFQGLNIDSDFARKILGDI